MRGSEKGGDEACSGKFSQFGSGELGDRLDGVDSLEGGARGIEAGEDGIKDLRRGGFGGFDDEDQVVFASLIWEWDDGEGWGGGREELAEALFQGFDGDEFTEDFDDVVVASAELEEGASAVLAETDLVGGHQAGGIDDGFPDGSRISNANVTFS